MWINFTVISLPFLLCQDFLRRDGMRRREWGRLQWTWGWLPLDLLTYHNAFKAIRGVRKDAGNKDVWLNQPEENPCCSFFCFTHTYWNSQQRSAWLSAPRAETEQTWALVRRQEVKKVMLKRNLNTVMMQHFQVSPEMKSTMMKMLLWTLGSGIHTVDSTSVFCGNWSF